MSRDDRWAASQFPQGAACLPGKERKQAASTLDQQFWCWGKDITRETGNLLLNFGLCRHRAPTSHLTSSAYVGEPLEDCRLILWGFGLYFGRRDLGGVFLRRFDFSPLWTPDGQVTGVYAPEQIVGLSRPRTPKEWRIVKTLLPLALEWVATYEHFVAETAGIEYRDAVLSAWRKPTGIKAVKWASEWEKLAERCRHLRSEISIEEYRDPWAAMLGRLERMCLLESGGS
jgi:hypothetical protein